MPIRFPVSGASSGLRVAALGEAVLGRLGLHRADEDGAVVGAPDAGRFAWCRADQAAGQRQRVVAADDLDGGAIVAVTEMGHEARDVDVGRTRAVAGRHPGYQAEALGAGLAPDVLLPLLAVVAQGAAQRPGGCQPLRGELERHLVEGDEVAGIAAAERDLSRQARRAGKQRAHRHRLAVREEPMPVERAPGLLDDAHARGGHHQAGWRRGDPGGRERQRLARDVRLGERQEAAQTVVEHEHGVLAGHLDSATPVVDLASQVGGSCQLDQAALLHAASEREQRRIKAGCAGEQQGKATPGLRRVHQP